MLIIIIIIMSHDQLFSCTTRVCVVTLLPGFFCI